MVRSRPDVLCQGRVVCRSRQQAAIDMEGKSSFIVQLFLVCAFVCLACGQSCPSQKQTSAKFIASSQRNQTGHWITQVRIEHGAGKNTVTTSTWTAENEPNPATCSCLESVQLVIPVTAPPPSAGPGYELHPGVGYYKLHSDPKTWHEARQICAQEGGHLAIINSEEESKVLQSMLATVSDKLVWPWIFIGFHDLYKEGQYLTIFDEPLNSTGFYRWSSPYQPDNAGVDDDSSPGQDCGSIEINGGLNDADCYSILTFICEQELGLDPSADVTPSLKCNNRLNLCFQVTPTLICNNNFDSPTSSDTSVEVSAEEEEK